VSEEDEEERATRSFWWGKVNPKERTSDFINRLLSGTSTWVFADVQDGKVQEDTLLVIVFVSDKQNCTIRPLSTRTAIARSFLYGP